MRRRQLAPDGTWVSIDVETTGLDPQRDRIIEIGAVRYEGGRLQETFTALINPGCALPPQIVALTGITDGDLEAMPSFGEVWPRLLAFLGQSPLIGHNLEFDLSFLSEEAARAGQGGPDLAAYSRLDTLAISRMLLPLAPGHALDALLQQLGLCDPGERLHRAADDAAATGRLLWWLYEHARGFPAPVLRAALGWLEPAREQMVGLYDFLGAAAAQPATATSPSGTRGGRQQRPLGVEWRQMQHERPGGLAVIPRGKLAQHLGDLFAAGGPLAEVLQTYEPRPQQADMCQAIAGRFARGGALAVEAGTGVGKSLAYLGPAVAAAESDGEKVIISTNTITLQDQLAERDVPLLALALGREVNCAVLKGRANYLCRRKWDEFLGGSLAADAGERLFGLRVMFWQAMTATGDSAELNLLGPEESLWPMVAGDEGCWGANCPHARSCYPNQARVRAEQADVVITNHAMVCANLAAEGRLLPEYHRLILDEAHHFEGVATDHLGLGVRRADLISLITGATGRGMRGARSLAAPGRDGWPSAAELSELGTLCQRAQAAVRALFDGVDSALSGGMGGNGDLLDAPLSELRYRTKMEGLPPGTYDRAVEAAESLRQLSRQLNLIAGRAPADIPAVAEVALLGRDAAGQGMALEMLAQADQADWVYWLEDSLGGPSVRGVPVDVSPMLEEQLWQRLHTVILVSATLSILSSFDHTLGRLGLRPGGDSPPESMVLNSPFDYRRQALLCVPNDLPMPGGGNGDREYTGAVSQFLADLLPVVGGRTLVLFTSHRMLREVHSTIRVELAEAGVRLLGQGIDGGRSRLLRALRTEQGVAVLGTSTFWEGVDVRGPQLSCLVIARLPFPRPDEPLVAARQEKLEREGKGSFAHYSLPQAVLRLKQGFGRLIRSTEDYGAVVLLDGRVLRRSYGRIFVGSLPGAARFFGTSAAVIDRIGDWLGGGYAPGAGSTAPAAVSRAKGTGIRWVESQQQAPSQGDGAAKQDALDDRGEGR